MFRWLIILLLLPLPLLSIHLEVQNRLAQDVNLHISGEGAKVSHRMSSPHNSTRSFKLNAKHFEHRPYFKVICSTGLLSNPDLGVCAGLDARKNHVILIEATEMGHIMECITLE